MSVQDESAIGGKNDNVKVKINSERSCIILVITGVIARSSAERRGNPSTTRIIF